MDQSIPTKPLPKYNIGQDALVVSNVVPDEVPEADETIGLRGKICEVVWAEEEQRYYYGLDTNDEFYFRDEELQIQ